MSIRTRIIFSLDFLLRGKCSFIMESFLLIIAFIVISVSFFIKESSYRYKYDMESSLNCNIDSMAFISLENIDCKENEFNRKKLELYNDISDMSEIKYFFSVDNGVSGSNISELMSLQDKYVPNRNNMISNAYMGYTTSIDNFIANNVILSKGSILSEKDVKDRMKKYGYGYVALYLGNAFVCEDIPIGTVYYMQDDIKHEYPHVVEGVLEKGTEFVSFDACCGNTDLNESPLVNTDNLIVSIVDYGAEFANSTNDINLKDSLIALEGLVILNPQTNYLSFKDSLYNLEKKYNAKITCRNLMNEFDHSKEKMHVYIRMLYKLFYVLVITSICFIMCMQTIKIVNNKKNYGILITNGVDIKELVEIEMIEVIIKLIFSTLFGLTISFCIIYLFFGYGRGVNTQNSIKYILFKSVLWKASIVNGLVMIVSSLCPAIIISRLIPADLLREEIK